MTDGTIALGTGVLASVQVSRRPILAADDTHTLLGYELLISDSRGLFSAFSDIDEFKATSEVVSHSVLTLGVDAVVGSSLAFLRFPRAQIIDSTPLIMPASQSVIEVGRDSWAARDPGVMASHLEAYADAGYRIALADFTATDAARAMIGLADYVKVDVGGRSAAEIREIIEPVRQGHAQVIAVNVDTTDDRDLAVSAGVDFVEGYYYSSPHVVEGRELPGFKIAYLQLLRKAYAEDVDFEEIAEVVKSDVALTYKLLRYVNSAHFGLRGRVESVERALVMLGVDHMRRWVSVATVSGLVDPRPQELAVLCATRARFCEALGTKLSIASPHDCFSLGMFSLLDVMLGKPMDEALADVPLAGDVDDALHGRPGVLADLLRVVIAYERGQWAGVTQAAEARAWPETELIGSYIEAIEWGRGFFSGEVSGTSTT